MLTQNGLHPLLNGLLLNMLYLNLNIKSIFFSLISGQTMSVSSFKKLEPEEYLRQHYQQGLRPDGRKGLTSLRPVSISVGSISVADGSAVVKQGDTIVVSMVFIVILKISKFQNVLLVSSNLPKTQRNFFQDFCPSL